MAKDAITQWLEENPFDDEDLQALATLSNTELAEMTQKDHEEFDRFLEDAAKEADAETQNLLSMPGRAHDNQGVHSSNRASFNNTQGQGVTPAYNTHLNIMQTGNHQNMFGYQSTPAMNAQLNGYQGFGPGSQPYAGGQHHANPINGLHNSPAGFNVSLQGPGSQNFYTAQPQPPHGHLVGSSGPHNAQSFATRAYPMGYPQHLQSVVQQNSVHSRAMMYPLANQPQGNPAQYPAKSHDQDLALRPKATADHSDETSEHEADDDDSEESEESEASTFVLPKKSVKGSKKPAKKATPKKATAAPAPKKKKTNNKFTPYPDVPDDYRLPNYVIDPSLSTAAACREYLAHPDPADVRALSLNADDWQHVEQNRVEEYAKKIWTAILEPYDNAVPVMPDAAKTDKKKKTKWVNAKAKYVKQQEKAMDEVRQMVGAEMKHKQVKACCLLLVQEVIWFHRNGMREVVRRGNQWYVDKNRKVDRKWRLDLDSKCSTRLDKVVQIIKDNKMVAKDLLQLNNFARIAEGPDIYLAEKLTYAQSNDTRQNTIDENKKKAGKADEEEEGEDSDDEAEEDAEEVIEVAKPMDTRAKKTKPAPVIQNDDESSDEEMDDEDSEDEYQPSKKRKRT